MTLILSPNLDDPDGFYHDLIAAHDGLTKLQSERLTARLVLILANQVGLRALLQEALALAKENAVARELLSPRI